MKDMYMEKLAGERLIEIARLTKERDEALEKLAAMESQEPFALARRSPKEDNSLMGGDGEPDWFKYAALPYSSELARGAESNAFFETMPLYAKPVPADKPAVVVPDGWDAEAYKSMSDNVEYWKTRATEAEDLFEKIRLDMSPTHMGEPLTKQEPSTPSGQKLVPMKEMLKREALGDCIDNLLTWAKQTVGE